MAKRRGTGRLKSKTQQQVARRQLDHGPQGPGAGGGAVALLLKAKALGMWTGGSNSMCQQCGEGGEVCECFACNAVWHRRCMGVGKATRLATDHLLEGSAGWGCGNCYDEATELHAKRQTEAKVRAKQDYKDCCTSAECTVTVEALDGSGYDYHCLLAATTEDVEECHERTAGQAHNQSMCWDTVAGLDMCTTHLESDTLKQMGAQAGGQYKVQLMGGGRWPGGVIESGESDSSYRYSSLGAADDSDGWA